jgi:hypothetical protein
LVWVQTGQVVKIIVNTFNRVGRDEPLGPHKRPVDRKREDREGDDVVAQKVIP